MNIQPRYIVPLLIKQPTWGGEYIAQFKDISDVPTLHTKIGQSYELYDNTLLSNQMADKPAYLLADPTDLAHPTQFGQTSAFSLQSVIDRDPVAVLGSRALKKTGAHISTLIKFTQAKNNSYQVHVQPGHEFGHWQPKPESWYYFQPGLVTLGLRENCDVNEYKQRCLEIDAQATVISQRIKSRELTLAAGKSELQQFIDQDHPRRFVNTVKVDADQVVDLSHGGTHHSWEIDANLPEGNVLYEVQVDVKDEYCTVRSFDQGSIKDDGSIRPLAIADYFQTINPNPKYNLPDRFFQPSQRTQEGAAQIIHLFNNQHYIMRAISWQGEYQGEATQTNGSFHHVFVKKGAVTLRSAAGDLTIPQGWSVFVPAQTKTYVLHSNTPAQVLVTSV